MKNVLTSVGICRKEWKTILHANFDDLNIYKSDGLIYHVRKRHPEIEPYFDRIPEIIEAPDYIGRNPKINNSMELVKIFDRNILVAIRIDIANEHIYVASIYEISDGKLDRRAKSGRLKQCIQFDEPEKK